MDWGVHPHLLHPHPKKILLVSYMLILKLVPTEVWFWGDLMQRKPASNTLSHCHWRPHSLAVNYIFCTFPCWVRSWCCVKFPFALSSLAYFLGNTSLLSLWKQSENPMFVFNNRFGSSQSFLGSSGKDLHPGITSIKEVSKFFNYQDRIWFWFTLVISNSTASLSTVNCHVIPD